MNKEHMVNCEHNGETCTQIWMGRKEKVCLDCYEVLWHEDKPRTWQDTKGNVLLTFDNSIDEGTNNLVPKIWRNINNDDDEKGK